MELRRCTKRHYGRIRHFHLSSWRNSKRRWKCWTDLNSVGFVWAGLTSGSSLLRWASTSITESGADFAYLRVAYGKPFGFLYAWTAILVVRATGNAAGAYTFGLYMSGIFFEKDCAPPPIVIKLAGAFLMLSITALICYSVKAAAKFQNLFTAAKFTAMITIIIGGLVALANGYEKGISNFKTAFNSDSIVGITFGQISMGFYQGLYSYAGWNNLNHVSEEVKDSHRNIPRGILIAVPLVTGFYILMNVAYLSGKKRMPIIFFQINQHHINICIFASTFSWRNDELTSCSVIVRWTSSWKIRLDCAFVRLFLYKWIP